jgi:aryl-alcohol dehydrogenase-like predicted oxidoreductase
MRALLEDSTYRRFMHRSRPAFEYVDILLAHDAPATLGSQEDLVDALETIIRQGKARHIGISCTHEIATKIAAQQRSPFTVVQFPAELLQINTPFSSPASNMLYIAARPFGAPGQAEAAKRVLQKLRHAAQTPAELREKLDGNTDTLFAELAFANIWWNTPAQIIVASMLHAHHLHANISAIHQTRCTPHEAQWLRDELVRGIV